MACTPDGYGLFDDAALQGLCFVRAAFEAGIGLDALARLCRALDAADSEEAAAQLAVLRQLVERRRQALANLEAQLTELAHGASEIPAWIVRSAQATQLLALGRSCGTQLSLSPAGARRRTRRHRGGGLLGSIESLRQCSDGAVGPVFVLSFAGAFRVFTRSA